MTHRQYAWPTIVSVFLLLAHIAVSERPSFAKELGTDSPTAEGTSEDDHKSALARTIVSLNDGFGEGWKQEVRVKRGDDPCDLYDLSVRDGWLYVRRTDKYGDLDWQVKLAELQYLGVPSISMIGEGLGFHVSSEDGRFFIRETAHLLRTVRQRSEGDGTIPRTDLLPEEFTSAGHGRAFPIQVTLSGWRNDSWFYAASGPDQERFNCIVRLNPTSMRGKGNGFQAVAGDVTYMFHGDTNIWNDGGTLCHRSGSFVFPH